MTRRDETKRMATRNTGREDLSGRSPDLGLPRHPRVHRGRALIAACLGAPLEEPAPEEPPSRDERRERRREVLPAGARDHPSPSMRPPWKTAKDAIQASAFIITTMKIGQPQEFVSRRTTATVDMHWQASTKNTIRLTAMRGE